MVTWQTISLLSGQFLAVFTVAEFRRISQSNSPAYIYCILEVPGVLRSKSCKKVQVVFTGCEHYLSVFQELISHVVSHSVLWWERLTSPAIPYVWRNSYIFMEYNKLIERFGKWAVSLNDTAKTAVIHIKHWEEGSPPTLTTIFSGGLWISIESLYCSYL